MFYIGMYYGKNKIYILKGNNEESIDYVTFDKVVGVLSQNNIQISKNITYKLSGPLKVELNSTYCGSLTVSI